MHYKNGREAKESDPVIGKSYGRVIAGKIHNLMPGQVSCNCTVAEVTMGGVSQMTCQTVGDFYHAEDAYVEINGGDESKVSPAASNTCER